MFSDLKKTFAKEINLFKNLLKSKFYYIALQLIKKTADI